MRQPGIQTRLLASPPVFFGSWGVAAWSAYQWTQHPQAWPLALLFGGLVAAVMKADAQVRTYKDWKRDWDNLGGAERPARRRLSWKSLVGILLALPLLSLLSYAGQHGGSQAVIGVLLILGLPILALAAGVQLWRWVGRGRAKRAARVQPVTVAVTRPLFPVPSLSAAYRGLPDHCRAIMGPLP